MKPTMRNRVVGQRAAIPRACFATLLASAGALAALLTVAPASQSAQPSTQPSRTAYSMQDAARPPGLSESELQGRHLFVKYCALCHDPVGQPARVTYGPALNRDLVRALGEDTVRRQILNGSLRMPGFQFELRTQEVEDLLAFLRTYPASGIYPPSRDQSGRPSEQQPEAPPVALRGTVTTPSGLPVAGVAVSARALGKTMTVTVFTDSAGRYSFVGIPRGDLNVWAQAEGFRRADTSVDTSVSPLPQLQLKITPHAATNETLRQMSSGEWLESLPAKTPEDRRMREILRLNCEECHALSVPLQRRFDANGWAAVIDLMQQLYYDGWHGPPDRAHPAFGETGALNEMNRHYASELATYLATVRGPNSPAIQPVLFPRPTGRAAQVVITAYDVPLADVPTELSWHDGSNWSDGAASGMHGAVGVHDLIVDALGNAWVTQSANANARVMLKINAASGQVTGIDFPKTARSENLGQRTHGIGLDSRDNVWFGIDQTLGKLVPATETFQLIAPPASVIDRMGNLTTDADATGKIWTDGVPGAVRFDPEDGVFSYYENEHPGPDFFFSYGVTGDSAGNGWWTVPDLDLVEMADVRTGKTREFKMRPPWAAEDESLATPEDRAFRVPIGGGRDWGVFKPGAQYPRRLGADKHGTSVWVPNYLGRNLARIDVATKQITYYRLPLNVHPYFAKVDKNHVVWMNSQSDDRVLSFDSKTKRWTIYRLPINGCESRNISVDDRHGDVWVPCYRASKVFRLHFGGHR